MTAGHLLWCGWYPVPVDCEHQVPVENGVKCQLPVNADCVIPGCRDRQATLRKVKA